MRAYGTPKGRHCSFDCPIDLIEVEIVSSRSAILSWALTNRRIMMIAKIANPSTRSA